MSPFAEDEEMLTLEDAAERFGVDVRTVVGWCHEGNLPAMRIGGFWRVRRTALELFLEGLERGLDHSLEPTVLILRSLVR